MAETELSGPVTCGPTPGAAAQHEVLHGVFPVIPSQRRGLRRDGNPGNSGGKPGRSGRIADAMRSQFQRMATDKRLRAALEDIAHDPDHRQCVQAITVILDRAYGKPEQPQRHLGPGDNTIVIVFQNESEYGQNA